MMRSMFSGVSSLRVHQTRMDVIANNIANVNTVGFKSQRATFADAFYQRIQGASGPDPTTGRAGTNPQQIGLGLNLASIDNIMTQGASQRTDNAMDVAIAGTGFFIVEDAGGQFFTRAGNISRDRNWNLNINGMQLMGWNSVRGPDGQFAVERGALQPISLGGELQNMPSEPTTIVDLVGNLNITQLDSNNQVTRNMAIFDSLGNRYLVDVIFTFHEGMESQAAYSPHGYWTFEFVRAAYNPDTGRPPEDDDELPTGYDEWPTAVRAFLEGDRNSPAFIGICLFNGLNIPAGGSPAEFRDGMVTTGTLAFNSRGDLVGLGPAMPNGDPITFRPPFDPIAGVPEEVREPRLGNSFATRVVPIAGFAPAATIGDTSRASLYQPGPPEGTPPPLEGTTITSWGTLTLNMAELGQRGQMNTNMRFLTMDGNGPGTLEDIAIGGDGTIMGRYSNGRTRILGQIPLAFFINPAGLERVGANLWVPTMNSGPFDGVGLVGQMQGGALEMSNVDLANEFTEMITTQRGFQAASRTITVSDEMLQELVNLRR